MGAFLLVMLCIHAQPSELLPLRARQLALSASREDGQCTKTNLNVVSTLHTEDKEARVFPLSSHQLRTEFLNACQPLSLQNVTLCQARHSGPSIDRAMNGRLFTERKSRGQWRTDPRYEKKRSSGSRLFGAASSNTRIDRNLCTTCRGTHPWNQPRLCLHRRLKCQ